MTKYKKGKIVKGVVTCIESYGAFMAFDEFYTGLIHISEISSGFVKDIHNFVNVGDYIYVEILAVDEEENHLKLSIKNINYRMFNVYSKPDRSPVCRMIAIAYIGVIDSSRVKFLKETTKTQDADWFLIDRIPNLGYDHQEILEDAIEYLKKQIFDTTILKDLFPKYFTLPQLHKTYESILNKNIDRRKKRKRLLQQNIIIETGKLEEIAGKKPSKLYMFAN